MYGMLRFDSDNPENKVLVQKPVDPISCRPAVQQACQSCRSKKVKCSGERLGCSRCRALSKPCAYSSRPVKRSRNTRVNVEAAAKPQQGTSPQPQLLPQYQDEERERERDPESNAQPNTDLSTMDVADVNGPVINEFDGNDMMAWSIPEFMVNGTGLSPAAVVNQLGATEGSYNSPEALSMAGVASPIDYWLSNFKNTSAITATQSRPQSHFQSEEAAESASAGILRPWDSAHPLAATAARVAEPKKRNSKVLVSPASTTSPQDLAATREISSTSLASSSSSSLPRRESCSCLQHITFLVNELETAKTETLDGQLATHKEAVDYAKTMLLCGSCSRRPENLMLLTFLTDRVLQLSETLVGQLVQPNGEGGGGGDEERPTIVFGELEIDSTPEWELLVSSMTALYLAALRQLMGRLKKSAEIVGADIVCGKAIETEKRVGQLVETICHIYRPS